MKNALIFFYNVVHFASLSHTLMLPHQVMTFRNAVFVRFVVVSANRRNSKRMGMAIGEQTKRA